MRPAYPAAAGACPVASCAPESRESGSQLGLEWAAGGCPGSRFSRVIHTDLAAPAISKRIRRFGRRAAGVVVTGPPADCRVTARGRRG
jgi:hypothetical protein